MRGRSQEGRGRGVECRHSFQFLGSSRGNLRGSRDGRVFCLFLPEGVEADEHAGSQDAFLRSLQPFVKGNSILEFRAGWAGEEMDGLGQMDFVRILRDGSRSSRTRRDKIRSIVKTLSIIMMLTRSFRLGLSRVVGVLHLQLLVECQ
jgi:hypothetical protein